MMRSLFDILGVAFGNSRSESDDGFCSMYLHQDLGVKPKNRLTSASIYDPVAWRMLVSFRSAIICRYQAADPRLMSRGRLDMS